MRKIRFRAWIEHDNKMFYDWYITSAIGESFYRKICPETEIVKMGRGYDLPQISDWQEKIIFMEYIGLNDRINNKEIYEGDVVKALNREYDCEDNWRDYFQTFEVTYLNGCWMFGNWNAHEFFNKYMKIEVIGNKFEGIKEE